MRIITGTISSRFLVFYVSVPVCSRNGSGNGTNLWVHTQNAGLCFADFMGRLFSDPTISLIRSLRDVFLSNSRNGCLQWLAVSRMLTVFLTVQLLPVFENWEGRPFWIRTSGIVVLFCPIKSGLSHWHKLLSLIGRLILGPSRSPEAHTAFFMRSRSTVKDSGRHNLLVCSSLTNLFLDMWGFLMKGDYC